MFGEFLTLTVETAALLVTYWVVDVIFRRKRWPSWLARVGASQRTSSWILGGLVALASWFFPWPELDPNFAAVAFFASVQATMMCWKGGTDDIDVAKGDAWWPERGMMLAAAIGVWWSPAWILLQLQLVTSPFEGWKHHGSLSLRVVQLCFAFALNTVVIAATDLPHHSTSALFVALFMMIGSHYAPTAVAKSILGPHWYSWMWNNRLYYVAASSYTWGWARFLPPKVWSAVLRVLAALNRPMQMAAWIAEAASPLLLLHPSLAIGLCGLLSVFHLAVFATTGIFFWEWIVTNALAIWLVTVVSPDVIDTSFGLAPWLLSVVIMFALPFRGKLWDPNPLGWWDTPLTQRVQWRIIGESGTVYDLKNDFMCPHERNYGRVHGCFMIDEQVFTYHLGEVWLTDLRDQIRALRDHPELLPEIRAKYGVNVYEPDMAARHERYLKRFLQQLNRGRRKFVFPRSLKWLKAPGGQFYYWGERPRFRAQEAAVAVEVWYLEEFWDGEVHHEFEEKLLRRFEVEDELIEEPCEELDEKVIDAMVLQRANGTLVDAPGWIINRARDYYTPPDSPESSTSPAESRDSV